jgi:septum site-determining protein MinC
MKKWQNVTIKGTKDGLTLHLNDDCSFDELKRELDEKLSATLLTNEDRALIPVKLETGYRYLTNLQQEELKELVRQKNHLVVEEINSQVITKEEADKQQEETGMATITKIVRSGQVIEVPGNLLLVGDVNPGGTVKAGGNIFVMGALRGIAHAGCNGNDEAVIAASVMKPSQLRISGYLNRAPDHHNSEEKHEMECAYIDINRQIVIDRLQGLMHLRPNLTRLEGGR